MWKGAAETLKARPQITNTRPNSTPPWASAPTRAAITSNCTEPA
jgi:hypothetical protein